MKRLCLGLLISVFFCLIPSHGEYTADEQAFITTFKHLYEIGDKKGILALVDWGQTPPDLKKTLSWSLTTLAGTDKITSISLVTYHDLPQDGSPGVKIVPTFTPAYWLMVKHAGNGGYEEKPSSSSGSMQVAVGWHDGKLMIPGMVYEKPNPDR